MVQAEAFARCTGASGVVVELKAQAVWSEATEIKGEPRHAASQLRQEHRSL